VAGGPGAPAALKGEAVVFMFGKAQFSSYAAADAGWTRYFRDPAWTAPAWKLSEIPPLLEAADAALFHKTTRHGRYDRALAACPECDDVLLINTAGQVTESCRASLVAAIDGRLLTPADLARAGRLWLINSVRLWTPAVLVGEAPTGGPSTGSCCSASS